jgi:hypothetical protein
MRLKWSPVPGTKVRFTLSVPAAKDLASRDGHLRVRNELIFDNFIPVVLMNDQATYSEGSSDKVEISIHLDSELLNQIKHLTNDPSKIIETAIRQWLRGELERDDELTRTFTRNPPVPPRGEWND